MGRYTDLFQKSIEAPEGFWADAAQAITWERKWDRVLDDSNKPFYRWFTGAETNTCFNALDRHALFGRADQVALIYDAEFIVVDQLSETTQSFDIVLRECQ